MLNIFGIDLASLRTFDVNRYQIARVTFASATSQHLMALRDLAQTQNKQGKHKQAARNNSKLQELGHKAHLLREHADKCSEHVIRYYNLCNLKIDTDNENFDTATADQLMTLVLQNRPDLGIRQLLDEDDLLLFLLTKTLKQLNFAHVSRDNQAVQEFVVQRRADLIHNDESWQESVVEYYYAARGKNLQNAEDYLQLYEQSNLDIDYPDNQHYVLALQFSHLIDLALLTASLSHHPALDNFKNILTAQISLLIDSAQRVAALERENQKYCCWPIFSKQSTVPKNLAVLNEQKLRR